MKTLEKPAILLSLSAQPTQVMILADSPETYKGFDREQVLNPLAIWPFFNGTIIPILGVKAKNTPIPIRAATAIHNGYADIAEQIADYKNITLDSAVGNTNRYIYRTMIALMFSISLITVILLFRRKFKKT